MGFKTKIGLQIERTVERERREEEKREEEEEEEKKKRSQAQKGMELTWVWILVWIIWILYGILEKFMSSKSRVLLGFLPNPKILKSKLGKTLNSTRSI